VTAIATPAAAGASSGAGAGQDDEAWTDAAWAAALLAVDPGGLGGAWVRAGAGPVRERWTAQLLHLLPPARASRTLKVGEFTRARIVATQGHDLVAEPA
jgi:hypothetical protein